MTARRSGGKPSRATTISDIAKAAGVSKATVSRVINGVPTVAADIAERVRGVVAELGYSPSQTARSLSLGESKSVGVLVPDLENPMFHQVLNGFNRAAARDGYHVVVTDSFEDAAREPELAIALRDRTDAIALFAPRMQRQELLALLPRVAPVTVFNRTTGRNASALLVDYREGVAVLAAHLIASGHRRIAYLAGPEFSRSHWERQKGLDDIREKHPDVEIIDVPCGHQFADGFDVWPALAETEATGVIAYNDVVAFGLIGRLGEEGISVPGDISVAGFDDIPFARYSSPSLTTMSSGLGDIGERIWGALKAEIAGTPDREPKMFPPVLVVRSSTLPRP